METSPEWRLYLKLYLFTPKPLLIATILSCLPHHYSVKKKKRSALLSRYDGILSIQIAVLKILLFVVLWNILKILVVSTEYGFHWLVKTL